MQQQLEGSSVHTPKFPHAHPCAGRHIYATQNTEFTIKLKQLEDELLYKLSTAEGDITGAGSRLPEASPCPVLPARPQPEHTPLLRLAHLAQI